VVHGGKRHLMPEDSKVRINPEFLADVGLGRLSQAEANVLLKHIYETLELRVGTVLADRMTTRQLAEFERYFAAKDHAGAFRWIETNFPDYRTIVYSELSFLTIELRQTAPTILALAGLPV
jgi:hypothetical protein